MKDKRSKHNNNNNNNNNSYSKKLYIPGPRDTSTFSFPQTYRGNHSRQGWSDIKSTHVALYKLSCFARIQTHKLTERWIASFENSRKCGKFVWARIKEAVKSRRDSGAKNTVSSSSGLVTSPCWLITGAAYSWLTSWRRHSRNTLATPIKVWHSTSKNRSELPS